MIAQPKIHDVVLFHDPHRGGFSLEFCPKLPKVPHFALCDGYLGMRISTGGIMGACITNEPRVTCVDSAWDRGGLLLNSFYLQPNEAYPSREWSRHFALSEGDTRSDPILIKQNPKDFEMWFGTEPLSTPATFTVCGNSEALLSVWLSDGLVRHPHLPEDHPFYPNAFKPILFGMRLDFARLAATYPLKSMAIWSEDFK